VSVDSQPDKNHTIFVQHFSILPKAFFFLFFLKKKKKKQVQREKEEGKTTTSNTKNG
jgi:hypothetical protein